MNKNNCKDKSIRRISIVILRVLHKIYVTTKDAVNGGRMACNIDYIHLLNF